MDVQERVADEEMGMTVANNKKPSLEEYGAEPKQGTMPTAIDSLPHSLVKVF